MALAQATKAHEATYTLEDATCDGQEKPLFMYVTRSFCRKSCIANFIQHSQIPSAVIK